MNILDGFCFFLPTDGPCNNDRGRCETESPVLLGTIRQEDVIFRKSVKQHYEGEKKNSIHLLKNL